MSDAGDHEKRLHDTRDYWDQAAASFDDEPDHGLRDPLVRHAWTEFLKAWLPAAPSSILDVGCGTGSLSVILAGLGHTVTGIDLSPNMIMQAQAKANTAGYSIEFRVMDATAPQFAPQSFDGIVCRHLLWMFPDRSEVLQRWADLLKRGGRLVLIEGYWNTGGGLHAPEIVDALPASITPISIQNLSDHPEFWGKHVTDERYAIIAEHVR